MRKCIKNLSEIKAILRLCIYKALYDKSFLVCKVTYTTGELSCLISFAWTPSSCEERETSEKSKMKMYVSAGNWTSALRFPAWCLRLLGHRDRCFVAFLSIYLFLLQYSLKWVRQKKIESWYTPRRCFWKVKRKGRDLTQPYDRSPYTDRKIQKATWQHKERHQKLRLHNDCGPT